MFTNNLEYSILGLKEGLNHFINPPRFYQKHIFSSLNQDDTHIVQTSGKLEATTTKDGYVYYTKNSAFLSNKEKITPEIIKYLIDEGADPNMCNCRLLEWMAARKNYSELIKSLLPIMRLEDKKTNLSLDLAIKYKRTGNSKLLLPVFIPPATPLGVLNVAIEYGNLDIVKLFIPYLEQKYGNVDMFKRIAGRGYHEIIKELIPVSNPVIFRDALEYAIKKGRYETVKELIPVVDPTFYPDLLRKAIKFRYPEIIRELLTVTKLDRRTITYCTRYCRSDEIANIVLEL